MDGKFHEYEDSFAGKPIGITSMFLCTARPVPPAPPRPCKPPLQHTRCFALFGIGFGVARTAPFLLLIMLRRWASAGAAAHGAQATAGLRAPLPDGICHLPGSWHGVYLAPCSKQKYTTTTNTFYALRHRRRRLLQAEDSAQAADWLSTIQKATEWMILNGGGARPISRYIVSTCRCCYTVQRFYFRNREFQSLFDVRRRIAEDQKPR